MSLLCNGEIKFDYIWHLQNISSELSGSLAQLVKKVWEKIEESAGPINIGTWCRKAECWLEVKKINHVFSKYIPELIINSAVKTVVIPIKNASSKSKTVSNDNSIGLSFEESLSDAGFWLGMAKWAKEYNVLDGPSRKFVFQVGAYYISKGKELSEKQLNWALSCYNETAKLRYNQPELKKNNNGIDGNENVNENFYLKKIINQDLERTPTFSVEAIRDFFQVELKHGESKVITIQNLSSNNKFEIEFKLRETRGEYRIFLKDLFKEISPIEKDILIFRKTIENSFTCEQIPTTANNYDIYCNMFEINKNHKLLFK